MIEKKYYTISEVSDILKLSPQQIRYLEKNLTNIDIIKIRGRRYFTHENIEAIKRISKNETTIICNLDTAMIQHRIEVLIENFQNLAAKIQKSLSEHI